MLTVIDEYTREALCVAAKPRMGHAEVLDALYPLFLKHGKPHYIRSDNGSEFIAHDLQAWLKKVGIKPIQIYPVTPRSTTIVRQMVAVRFLIAEV
jgi:putative transposase